ncbi:hypothetical protein [Streptacidiphilus carbonis]|uniref:hypothetical protein n=1 Tax=Streptacidiphilus carbonis TaxID=105422 RepID=UPI0005AB31DA|nr:hypothetical protein [Streptacidiphilus carbonis]
MSARRRTHRPHNLGRNVLGLAMTGALAVFACTALRTDFLVPQTTGTVNGHYAVHSPGTPTTDYYLTLRDPQGRTATYQVTAAIYGQCPRRSRYPACKSH